MADEQVVDKLMEGQKGRSLPGIYKARAVGLYIKRLQTSPTHLSSRALEGTVLPIERYGEVGRQ